MDYVPWDLTASGNPCRILGQPGVAQNISPHFREVDNHCGLSDMKWSRDHQGLPGLPLAREVSGALYLRRHHSGTSSLSHSFFSWELYLTATFAGG